MRAVRHGMLPRPKRLRRRRRLSDRLRYPPPELESWQLPGLCPFCGLEASPSLLGQHVVEDHGMPWPPWPATES